MCGIIGVIGPKNLGQLNWASYEVYRGLLTLQHRGQDASGILSYDTDRKKFYGHKDLGLVSQVFEKRNIEKLTGPLALGHTRYATTGSDERDDLQPLVTGIPFGVGMVHNGNILNYHPLAREMSDELDLQLLTNNDLEILLHLWCQHFLRSTNGEKVKFNFEEAYKAAEKVFGKVEGAYAVVGTVAEKGLIGFRDPNGIRPLVLGKKSIEGEGECYCLGSETLALNFLGYEYVRDIEPGEFIFIDFEGTIKSKIYRKEEIVKAPCMFEWIYFSGAESSFETQSVYGARLNLGRVLARKIRKLIEQGEVSPDIVCPVPDTSRTASIALAENLGLPYREGLIKNRYVHRSFILNTQEKREKAVELKLSPVRSEIEGKSILLVDDSVVRGTTSKKIIDLLKRYGAKDITLAITCPPIRYGCFYGIDFPKAEDLIANGKNIDEIANWVGANKVIFLDENETREAIGISELCMACINNKYPTSIKSGEEFAEKRNEHKEPIR
ncbi:MAG: amidophosphoribosyltransferase [Halobacteriovoraceae bacterium]|nr:amidophosphoribosyltransferase [Halobacteriovoraceae bacterium]